MRLASKIAFNYFFHSAGRIGSLFLGVLALGITARYLGVFDFGQYTTILAFASFFAVFADLGLSLVTVGLLGEEKIEEKKLLGNLMLIRAVTAVVILGMAPIVVLFFPYSQDIKTGIFLAALGFMWVALTQVLTGIFQKKLALGGAAQADIAGKAVMLVGILWVVWADAGLNAVLWVFMLSSAVHFGLLWMLSRRLIQFSWEFDREIWIMVAHRSWPVAIAVILNLIYLKTDTIILSLYRSQDDVGFYGAAYRVVDALIVLPFLFAGIALPILSREWLRDKYSFARILQKSFDAMAVLAAPIVAGAWLLGEDIMQLVAGSEFASAGVILAILSLAAGCIFLQTIIMHALVAAGKQKKVIKAYAFTAVTALIGYIFFIPRFGYFGAAWVTVYSEAVIMIASFVLARIHLNFTPSLAVAIKAITASGVMALVLWLLNFHLWAGIPIGAIVYFTALYFIGGLNFASFDVILSDGVRGLFKNSKNL